MRRKPIRTVEDLRAIEAENYESAVPARSTYDLLLRGAQLYGERTAVTYLPDGDLRNPGQSLTYRELLSQVTRAANLFRALGVGPQDAVAILAPAIPEAHFALWGAQVAGRACPINFMLSDEHIAALVNASRAKVLVALGDDGQLPIWGKVGKIRAGCPQLREILRVGEGGGDSFAGAMQRQSAELEFERRIGRDDIAAYFHTGGTTGAPRLALHTHGNQVHTSWFAGMFYDIGPEDVLINGFPLFHVAGTFVYGVSAFCAGARLVLPTRLGLRHADFMPNFWRFVTRERVTMLCCVPTVLGMLLDLPAGDADLSSVRVAYTGGSPLPAELAAAFEAKHRIPVRNILGMTESAGLVAIEPLRAPRTAGSCGLRLPYTEVKAAPVAGGAPRLDEACAADQPGVVALRGPHVGPGYSDPAHNAGMFEDGWLVSGDLGHVDGAGRIFVTGRMKDIIIRGAHNIDPAVIEEALAAHPAVQACAAVGEPDPHAGEVPVAFIQLRQGYRTSAAEILAQIAPRIPEPAAVPKRVTVLDAMPLTAIGKIYKPALRARAIEHALAAALAPLARERGAPLTVRGVDEAAGLMAEIRAGGAADREALEARIAALLARYPVRWRLA
jgi:fatty-acyl-CoA synthase